MNIPTKIVIIKHFEKEDTTFDGDYISIDVFFNDQKVYTVGDQYHDKGITKVLGFLDACEWFFGQEEWSKIKKETILKSDS